ncbi:MAG: BlaI/MecI/CopY family transcriptional regulator [Armatimonadetes bacterium]|nr:BlaI/MecI/CopY family transcriptional regulator [Armatimonadota bacterium]
MAGEKGVRDYIGIRKGLEGYSLGELEAQLLDVIWELDKPVTTSEIFKIMYPRRELSYSTIMLTMAKLARKGILLQERTGEKKKDPFIYTPNISRWDMGYLLLDDISRKILRVPLTEIFTKFSGDAPHDMEAELERTKALINAHKKGREEEG